MPQTCETKTYLNEFCSYREWCDLYRNETSQGYTKSANRGLKLSKGELVILLNSDTMVTKNWIEKLCDAAFSLPEIGIVGPISNAASCQSIPENKGKRGQTAINQVPDGLTIEDMNEYCEQWTCNNYLPWVPLVHGFCFCHKKECDGQNRIF